VSEAGGGARPLLPSLRDVIARHDLTPKRSLGQHFLLDPNLTDRIARAAGNLHNVNVIEIGPGPGGLTRSLLAAGAARVVAVEKDSRCVAAIRELADVFPARLEVVEADALDCDIPALVPVPRRIVANLPYNIAAPLLIGWLHVAPAVLSMTLMVQKEIADRLVAAPRSSDYGRLSVIAQWLCKVQREFNVDRNAFTPPPKVTSTVVTLTPHPKPLVPADWWSLEQVTAAAFGQRRKMLRGSLKILALDPQAVGIDPTRRAEELSVEEFCRLAQVHAERTGRPPSERGHA
jgi:16S rRNA (adenine1518-N6/adenine1519-N6)-dimethyltransferase